MKVILRKAKSTPFGYSVFMALKGAISYLPNCSLKGMRGHVMECSPLSSRYYYSVWMRHLINAAKNNLPTKINTIAEFGPGDSLGVGISALLSGARQYCAFDAVPYAPNERNLKMLEELIVLFKNREKIPGKNEFPLITPEIDSCEFPHNILTYDILEKTLNESHIALIRNALRHPAKIFNSTSPISYIAPWDNINESMKGVFDLIISQAVLEHVNDLKSIYSTMGFCLRENGFISHAIDFRSHGLSLSEIGHWAYPDFVWKIIVGRRPFLINREPFSKHCSLMKESGFYIKYCEKNKFISQTNRIKFSKRFRNMSEDDASTATAFIQAVKKVM